MKISVISPVKNEVEFAGYSAMSVLPYVHEILYGVAKSDDGTEELLSHVKREYAGDKLKIFSDGPGSNPVWDFDPLDMQAYNDSYNRLIKAATGDAVWFLHPDMIVTNPEGIQEIKDGPFAWWVNITSYARDMRTQIVQGRTDKWKNIQRTGFGLHYWGGYGSQNEDFYFSEITGDAHKFYGFGFDEYPYEVGDSGLRVNHYCEVKSFARRLEKMKRCLRTQHPDLSDEKIDEIARLHPRVSLDDNEKRFGLFKFDKAAAPIPTVFDKFREFQHFKKEKEIVNAGN